MDPWMMTELPRVSEVMEQLRTAWGDEAERKGR